MLSARLIRLIEDHSDQIIQGILVEVRRDELLPRYRELSDSELISRFENVCRNLGHWLAERDELVVGQDYEKLGEERFNEQIPLHEVVHAAHVVKNRLTSHARDNGLEQTPVELYAEGELERLINRFFDRIVFHIVRGYEKALVNAIRTAV
jgi:hypothetical protein